MINLTTHARQRCAQRGIRNEFLSKLIDLADIDKHVGSNCRMLIVSRRRALKAGDDRLSRYGVIVSDDSYAVVTVAPLKGHRRRVSGSN